MKQPVTKRRNYLKSLHDYFKDVSIMDMFDFFINGLVVRSVIPWVSNDEAPFYHDIREQMISDAISLNNASRDKEHSFLCGLDPSQRIDAIYSLIACHKRLLFLSSEMMRVLDGYGDYVLDKEYIKKHLDYFRSMQLNEPMSE